MWVNTVKIAFGLKEFKKLNNLNCYQSTNKEEVEDEEELVAQN